MVVPRYSGMGGVLTRGGGKACDATPEDHWCHYQCGSLRVSYSGHDGLSWVAVAFFRHASCVEFSSWSPGDSLVRTDLLVTTLDDMKGLHSSILESAGFRGVVVLVDFACGSLHVPPPSLRCWQSRTLLVGGDRFAGQFHHGAFLETPPGVLSWLMRKGIEPKGLDMPASTLRASKRTVGSAGAKTKLLAYISDVCSPEEEKFFDMAVDGLKGYGIIEALGRCHGSHPELVPSACGGPCEAARQNPAEALKAFRFAVAFDPSASSGDHCPQHITHRVFDALVAGAIPVYRGPDEALAVLDRRAIIHIPAHRTLQEGFAIFRQVVLDAAVTVEMMAAPALLPEASYRWFMWEEALRGERNRLAMDAQKLAASLLRGAPHWRCAEHALLRTPTCRVPGSDSSGECSASGDLGAQV